MSDKKMWFGTLYQTKAPGTSSSTVNSRMQWVPVPDTGMDAGSSGYSELMEFENGGADVVDSAATHRTYEMDWNIRQASGAGGLDIVKSYQQGVFGPGLIYFADPMNYTTNLFPPHWGTPSLSQLGWKAIGTPSASSPYLNVGSNIYNYPNRSFSSATGLLTKPEDPARLAVIPIPTGYELRVCFRCTPGAFAGGSIAYQAINLNGSYAASGSIAVDVAGTAPVTIFSATSYRAVEFWVNGGVTQLVSAMAWLTPSGALGIPNMSTTAHIPGAGHTGCKFTSKAIVESYIMADRQFKGMSTSLTEVGAWQKAGT